MLLKKLFTLQKNGQTMSRIPNKNVSTLETECAKTRTIINDLAKELDHLRKSQPSHLKSSTDKVQRKILPSGIKKFVSLLLKYCFGPVDNNLDAIRAATGFTLSTQKQVGSLYHTAFPLKSFDCAKQLSARCHHFQASTSQFRWCLQFDFSAITATAPRAANFQSNQSASHSVSAHRARDGLRLGPFCARRPLVNRDGGAVDRRAFKVWIIAHPIENTHLPIAV